MRNIPTFTELGNLIIDLQSRLNKMRKIVASILKKIKRYRYLISKLSENKHVVIYTKFHPIYTSIFEDAVFDKYVFVYLDPLGQLSLLERRLLKKAKVIHADANSLSKDIFSNKVVVIECEGLPTDAILFDERIKKIYVESRAAIKSLVGIYPHMKILYPSVPLHEHVIQKKISQDNAIVLTAVGYGGMVKGFDVVYKIFETLKDQYPLKLVICGTFGHNYKWYPEITKEAYDASDFPGIQKKMRENADVQFGPVKKHILQNEVYPDTDIYLHFSRMETFGYSIIEAMSFGIPVIATNVRAIPEMVVNNVNGFLVNDFSDDFNSKEWFDKSVEEGLIAVKKLLDDPALRQQMGNNSRKRVEDIFNIEIKKRMLENDYDELLK